MTISTIGKLSDHAAVIVRQRSAKACVILVVEDNGQVSQGVMAERCPPAEIQDALCEAIVFNAEIAKGKHG